MRKSRKLMKQFCAVSLAAVMGISMMGVWGGSAQAEESADTNVKGERSAKKKMRQKKRLA